MARRYWIIRGYDGSEEIFKRAIPKSRLPAMFNFRDFVGVGGLMAYSIDLADVLHRVAIQIASVLNGTKPRDIPFYEPTNLNWLSI